MLLLLLLSMLLVGANGLVGAPKHLVETPSRPGWSRRTLLQTSSAAVSAAHLPAVAAAADVTVSVNDAVWVNSWPSIEYMEPIVELKQLMDGLVDGVADDKNWPFIRRRLDKFFSGGPGGIFSDRYFYIGVSAQVYTSRNSDLFSVSVCVPHPPSLLTSPPCEPSRGQYVFQIKYEGSGRAVDADKLAKQEPITQAMEELQKLRTELKDPLLAPAIVRGCAARARDGVDRWLGQVPAADVERTYALIRAVRAADVDRNGELSPAELTTLPATDQQVWKARQNLFG